MEGGYDPFSLSPGYVSVGKDHSNPLHHKEISINTIYSKFFFKLGSSLLLQIVENQNPPTPR